MHVHCCMAAWVCLFNAARPARAHQTDPCAVGPPTRGSSEPPLWLWPTTRFGSSPAACGSGTLRNHKHMVVVTCVGGWSPVFASPPWSCNNECCTSKYVSHTHAFSHSLCRWGSLHVLRIFVLLTIRGGGAMCRRSRTQATKRRRIAHHRSSEARGPIGCITPSPQ